jgi:hypothetical protein
MTAPKTATYANLVAAKKVVIGSKVVNQQNEDLGKIEDVVVDVDAGRIGYAVLSFGGFLGMGDKYFALPWEAFRFTVAEKIAILNVDRKLLENAPGFDKDDWPNMADFSWGSEIFSHDGFTPYWQQVPSATRRDRF